MVDSNTSNPDKIYRCPAKVSLVKPNLNCNTVDFNAQRETCTFFNRKDYDISNIKERYHKEVEELRAKLREIQKSRLLAAELKQAYHHDREVIEVRSDDTQQNVQIVSPVKCTLNGVSVRGSLHDGIESHSSTDAAPRKKVIRRVKGDKLDKARMVAVKSRSKLNLIKLRQTKSKIIKQEITTESELSET